jgi:hypothetical protein
VILTDPKVSSYYPAANPEQDTSTGRRAEIAYRFAKTRTGEIIGPPTVFVQGIASTATFGLEFEPVGETNSRWPLGGKALRVIAPTNNPQGCDGAVYPPINTSSTVVAFVTRGNCSFYEKLTVAKAQNAVGVIVAGVQSQGDEDHLIRPAADGENDEAVADVGLIYVMWFAGQLIQEVMEGSNKVWVQLSELDALEDGEWDGRGAGGFGDGVGGLDVESGPVTRSGLMIGGLPIQNLDFAVP